MLMNSRSIVNKYCKFSSLVKNHNPELIGVTETWLQPEIKFNIPGYVIFRSDRDTRGGGALLCVKPSLKPTFINEYKVGSTEMLVVSILNNIGIFLIYRPPNAPQTDLASLVNILESEMTNFHKFFIMGDLNLPLIDWNNYSTNDARSKIFIDFCNDHSLFQFVNFPTRANNILDVVISSNNNVFSVKPHPPLGASDHAVISFSIDETCDDSFEPFYIFDYDSADYELINAYLMTINWDYFFHGCTNTHEHYARFHDLIAHIHNEFIPVKFIHKHRNFNDRKWKKLYRKKCKKWKKFQLTSLERDRVNYESAKNEYDNHVSKGRVKYEKSLFYNRRKKTSTFYSYVKRHISSDILIPTLSTTEGLSTSSLDKAETFSGQFKKAFVSDNNILPRLEPLNINFASEFSPVTPAEAIHAMKSINQNSSPGPDGIPPTFFRKCAANFAIPVSVVLNRSFFEGVVLDNWKLANVIPIFKKGDKSDPINYRPISITPVFPKLAEFIIRDRILSHLCKNNLMTTAQHGFTAGRSVSTNLLQCLDDWTQNLEGGFETDILYFDFSKAFDSVVHSKLIHKLRQQYLFHEIIINWVQNFLSNRTQRVKVGNAFSTPIPVTSGVAQGTLLGPLLFIMYTNDIASVIQHSSVSLYADDTKLYKKIIDNHDRELLHHDAEGIVTWSISWQLPLNSSKTVFLSLPYNEDGNYMILGSEIVPQHSTKDLGIIMQHNLGFKEHCTGISRTAAFIVRNLNMCFPNHNPHFYVFMYKTYIRPILESNTVVFSPHTVESIDTIEKVQRQFTKYLPGMWDMSYTRRMELLGIKSLEERRIFFDLLFLFKVIMGHTDLNPDSFFQFNTNPTRGHGLKIVGTFARTNIRKYFWPNRVVDIWNNLPTDIINQRSDFRGKLESLDLSPYCLGSAFHT